MNKIRLFAGIIVFGSLWGFAECIIGPILSTYNLPSGAIMTGLFAIGLMTTSRILYKQKGMQIGMGLVAGTLRMFNPFGGCVICSAFAIMAEGLLFEIIWYKFSDLKELNTMTMKISMGVVSSYLCYVGGYIITQILTPLVSSAGFYLSNLLVFIPQILSRGLPAAIIGGTTIPIILVLQKIDINVVKNKIYYPTTAGISALCWIIVVTNWILLIRA